MPEGSIGEGADPYGIRRWGGGYFEVDGGRVRVRPQGAGGNRPSIDLLDLVEQLRTRDLRTPLLIRFSDILGGRVREIAGCFERAMLEHGYAGRYRGVYPIKVNQQRQVVEELVRFGRGVHLGLEVGSKPELLVGLALLDSPDALLVCNGYKDGAYIELALLADRLACRPIIVLERPRELETVLKAARNLGIRPRLGVRARLSARGEGKWIESSGDRAKFGLTATQIVGVVEVLRREDMLDCLELLHFHQGSQVGAIHAHKEALREASRIYVGLHELGARPHLIDIGGGLGVDYDGSQSHLHSSVNYSMQEYANGVVSAIARACDDRGVPHPDIVTEAGRSLVSHASVLIFDVLDVDEIPRRETLEPPGEDEHRVISELYQVESRIAPGTALECYHDAIELKEKGTLLFALGDLDLRGRARMEELFWSCCERILSATSGHVPDELRDLERTLADTYYGNFSVFQSLPDTWAMGQLFPVMPIHRLDSPPTRRATLADLTCDSDGKLDRFIDLREVRRTLPLHRPGPGPYYIGVFLVGAYQETLGELHNLFGDTNTVHIGVEEDGTPRIEQVIPESTAAEVLSHVQYEQRWLLDRVRLATEGALRAGRITISEAALLRRRYEQGLAGSTYLDPGE